MFRIGNIYSKKYVVRVSVLPHSLLKDAWYLTPAIKELVAPYYKLVYDDSRQFFLCSVVRGLDDPTMVDLNKDANFPFVSFRFPPKPNSSPSPADTIYETEYRYWNHNKDYYDPMLYLHRSTIEKVIDKCAELSMA